MLEPSNLQEIDYDKIFRLPKDVTMEILPSLLFTQCFRESCLRPKQSHQGQLKLSDSLVCDARPFELL